MSPALFLGRSAPLVHPGQQRARRGNRAMGFSAVIVAAGSGSRAGFGPAKQWRLVAGHPVLRWAAEGLRAAGAESLVVVVAEGEVDHAAQVLAGLDRVRIVIGGAARADSV